MNIKNDVLNIAMNLNRIGNWAADDFDGKQKRIEQFLLQTQTYLDALPTNQLPPKLQLTVQDFQKNFTTLKNTQKISNPLIWAEKMMTWGNILTHRASLIK